MVDEVNIRVHTLKQGAVDECDSVFEEPDQTKDQVTNARSNFLQFFCQFLHECPRQKPALNKCTLIRELSVPSTKPAFPYWKQ